MKLFCAVLALLMVLPVLASAKGVLYVTSDASCWHGQCGCLPDEEQLFCERMGSLGYTVTITSEGYVITNGNDWKGDWQKADVIFLGDVSTDVLNATSQNGDDFCNIGLWDAVNHGRKLFATFGSARVNGVLIGCALRGNTLIVTAPVPNGCDSRTAAVTQAGYITKGKAVDSTFQAYGSSASVAVNSNNDWIAVSCTINGVTKLWSVLSTRDSGTFWGLDKPSEFTNETWNLFDRAVIYTMGDHVWNVSAFTVPELPTAGQPTWVVADIVERGSQVTSGNVRMFYNGAPVGNLGWDYTARAWVNRNVTYPAGAGLKVGGDQGNATLPVAGNLSVTILSTSYHPGTNVLKADVTSGGTHTAADVRYRLRAANMSVVASGMMNEVNAAYQAEPTLGDWNNLTMEVYARTSSDWGGGVKTLGSVLSLVQGTDWTLDPGEIQLSATSPGSETFTVTVGSMTSRVTGLRASGSGQLASNMIIGQVPSSVNSGYSASFNVTVDWTSLQRGTYTGGLKVESDQFSADVPIKFYYLFISGNWISVKPGQWSVTVPAGQKASGTFLISNKAPYPSSAISVRPSTGLENIIGVRNKPSWVLASGTADIQLTADATDMSEGVIQGTVTISSSLGSADLPVTITVIADFSGERDRVASALSEAEERIAGITWTDTGELQAKASAVSGQLSAFDSASDAGDWNSARTALDNAESGMQELQAALDAVGQPIPWDMILIAAGACGAVVAGYFGYRWWKNRRKKAGVEEESEESEELPSAEDRYRTEWY